MLCAFIFFLACVARLIFRKLRAMKRMEEHPEELYEEDEGKENSVSKFRAEKVAPARPGTAEETSPRPGTTERPETAYSIQVHRPMSASDDASRPQTAAYLESTAGSTVDILTFPPGTASSGAWASSRPGTAMDSQRPTTASEAPNHMPWEHHTGHWTDFKQRLQHSMLIVLTLFYLRSVAQYARKRILHGVCFSSLSLSLVCFFGSS
jgi:hypothetical protein